MPLLFYIKNNRLEDMQEMNTLLIPCNTDEISDGYHTFGELYEHRCHLFVALMRSNPDISWRANNHVDGTMFDGFFIAGMHLPTGDISYHLPLSMWTLLDGSGIATSLRGPAWDGHTADDVVTRLRDWCGCMNGVKKPSATEIYSVGLLSLLDDIRFACGDNGKRMQPELVDYIRRGFETLWMIAYSDLSARHCQDAAKEVLYIAPDQDMIRTPASAGTVQGDVGDL